MTSVKELMRALRYAFVDFPRPRQTLLVDPGKQVLVLNFAQTMTADEADRIKARIRADFPGLPVLLVCCDDIGLRERDRAG